MKPADPRPQLPYGHAEVIWSITSQVASKTAERHFVTLPSSGVYELIIKKKENVHTPTRTAQVDIRLVTAAGVTAFERTWKSVGGLGSPKETKVKMTIDLQPESAPAQLEATIATTVLLGRLKYKGTLMRKEKGMQASPVLPTLTHRRTPSGSASPRGSPPQSNTSSPREGTILSSTGSPRSPDVPLRSSPDNFIGGARLTRMMSETTEGVLRRSNLVSGGIVPPKRLSNTPPPTIIASDIITHHSSPPRTENSLSRILLPNLITHITGSVASTVMRNFLITFTRFTTTTQVLLEVNKRAESTTPPPDVDPSVWKDNELTYRMRLANLVRSWIVDHWSSLQNDSTARAQIEHLIGILEEVGLPRVASQLSLSFQKRLKDGPDRPLPPRPAAKKLRETPILSALAIDAVDLAQQLTLISVDLLRSIPLTDYLKKPTPLIIAMRDRFDAITRWVVTEIVSGKDRKARQILQKHFLRQHNDFHSTMAVVQGLTHSSLTRHDIEELPSKEAKTLEGLKQMCDISTSVAAKALRGVVRSCAPPAVAPLPLVLQEISLINDTQPDADPPYINFVKYDAIGQVIGELVLEPSQSTYSFEIDQDVRDYILAYSAPPLTETSPSTHRRSHGRTNSIDKDRIDENASKPRGASERSRSVTDRKKRDSLTDMFKFLRGSSMIGESPKTDKSKKRAVLEVEPLLDLAIAWLEKHALEAFLPCAKEEKHHEMAVRIKAQVVRGERAEIPAAPDGTAVVSALLQLRAADDALIPDPLLEIFPNVMAITDSQAQRAAVATVLQHFPPRNFATLRRIVFFLRAQQAIAGLDPPFRSLFADLCLPSLRRSESSRVAVTECLALLVREADFVFADRPPDAAVPGIERLADEQRSKLQQQLRSACLLLGLQVSHSFITSAPPPPIEKKRSHIRTEAPHKPESRLRAQPAAASVSAPVSPLASRTSAVLTGGYLAPRPSLGSNATSPASPSLVQHTSEPIPPIPRPSSPLAHYSPAQLDEEQCVVLPSGRMLFSHTAEGDGEISVAAGTIVGLLDTSREDWWNVQVDDNEGWVPRSYVAPLSELQGSRIVPSPGQSLSATLSLVTATAATTGESDERKEAFAEGEDGSEVDLLAEMIEAGRFTDVEAYLMMMDKRQSRQLSSLLASVLQQRILSGEPPP